MVVLVVVVSVTELLVDLALFCREVMVGLVTLPLLVVLAVVVLVRQVLTQQEVLVLMVVVV
jgi:hypothetical protein